MSRRWRILALLSGAELLGMSLWFTASAVSPQLGELWGLGRGQVGWLTTMVQLGFVAGPAVAAILNLADVVPERPYFAASALLGALANAGIAVAPGYGAALLFRFLTGFFLAGVYPPAMKMIATWFRSGRGLAIGTIVGALTVGKATPYLVHAFADASVAFVVGTASAGAALAGVLVLVGYRTGPYPFERRPFSWSLVGTVLGHRPTRLAIYGYLGHMWELHAVWSLVAVYFSAFFAARRGGGEVLGSLAGFATIAIGGVGCVVAGAWADRWGFAVVADTAQFTALVTEVAPKH
ncbi:MAG: MFS transporter [Gemmatimonadota bacterium]